jgi:V8-like Glu-specific endopeptidase
MRFSWTRMTGVVAAAAIAVTGTLAVAGTARATAHVSVPATDRRHSGEQAAVKARTAMGTVHAIDAAAQRAARAYWTPARLAAATGAPAERQEFALGSAVTSNAGVTSTLTSSGTPGEHGSSGDRGTKTAHQASGPPAGTPASASFGGVPTVGPLFYTNGGNRHFCTASVVNSPAGSLVMTAAHCVYSGGYSAHLEFIPGYSSGSEPYGVWTVKEITVAEPWRQSQDPKLDVAFLEVEPPANSVGPIEIVTGALNIAFALPDAQHVTVIGYNNTAQKPIQCTVNSFKFRPDQMEFYCRGYWMGTSGGPWIIGYNPVKGTGTVYGVIGGYEAGGYVSWASYSPALEQPALDLFNQADAEATAQPAD